eukprot:gnl/MRDRNA2_/MRDRNA2_96917_c0_seq1.p1 gnl/MRDRNA2_/MRDRNA2_96917_c0~~gnl/MRDRNA2_/MRDRNA2_96917_c0_seq1.p1  ORF type:complete len:165 (-),score=15.46 gnl/MRDRNA2_/MRDRNA2_96917_c0_seq1:55-549(-)
MSLNNSAHVNKSNHSSTHSFEYLRFSYPGAYNILLKRQQDDEEYWKSQANQVESAPDLRSETPNARSVMSHRQANGRGRRKSRGSSSSSRKECSETKSRYTISQPEAHHTLSQSQSAPALPPVTPKPNPFSDEWTKPGSAISIYKSRKGFHRNQTGGFWLKLGV